MASLHIPKLRWTEDGADYDAAERYLSLRLDSALAVQARGVLEQAKFTRTRANDVLRAVRREPLPLSDPGVARVLREAKKRRSFSPALVATFDDESDIADGYHRISLAYLRDPFEDVVLKLGHIHTLYSHHPIRRP